MLIHMQVQIVTQVHLHLADLAYTSKSLTHGSFRYSSMIRTFTLARLQMQILLHKVHGKPMPNRRRLTTFYVLKTELSLYLIPVILYQLVTPHCL
jgi:hypothetical protein